MYQTTTKSFKFFDRFWGRQFGKNEIFDAFSAYFHNGESIRHDVIPMFIEKFKEFLAVMEEQDRFRFYSSSVLLIYEGDPNAEQKIDIRGIDFARVFPIKEKNGRDTGYIFGLRQVIKMLNYIGEKYKKY